jgi:hypothetical protein
MFSAWSRYEAQSPRSAGAVRSSSSSSALGRAAKPVIEALERRDLLAAVVNEAKIKVAHRTVEGLARNQSVITIPLSEEVTIADADQIQVRGYAFNPSTGGQKKIVIEVAEASVLPTTDGTGLVQIITNRMMRKDSPIFFYDGALEHTEDGSPVPEQKFRSPRGLNREDFTLATRVFIPTNDNLFDDDIFDGAGNGTTENDILTEADVEPELEAFLASKVAQGRITDAQRDAALDGFNSTTARNIIPDHNVRAAVYSLVGTVAEAAIDAFVDGENLTGRPYTFIGVAASDPDVPIADTDIRESDGRLRIRVQPGFSSEPFQVLSAVLAHESIHQDADAGGIEEEVIGNIFESVVWAQQLDVDPDLATAGTRLVKEQNTELLALLNSGKANFPVVGLLTPWVRSDGRDAALKNYGQGVFFGSDVPSGGRYLSWENYLRRQYIARGGISKSSNGNPTLSNYVRQFTGEDYTGRFNNSVTQLIDANLDNVLSTRIVLRLASALDLTVD